MRAILEATGARELIRGPRLQSLWSGYGELFRAQLVGGTRERVVIKRVQPPTDRAHPRGWSTSLGHERKLRSYDVELSFYRDWAPRLGADARVAECLAAARDDDGWWFVLEDLDASGYHLRRTEASPEEVRACLRWLARFHARFMGDPPGSLWRVGTYWHLATRSEELAATRDPALREAAPHLDERLSDCRFPTVVHGDAKLANFCFTPEAQVAGVDFQYAGGGTGMKDVAYFLSSLRDVEAAEAEDAGHLETYFLALREALQARSAPVDVEAVEQEGRALYPLAWADFFRFLAGWAPGHWKMNAYSRRMTARALEQL
ncbi:MAG: phosphotransferase [Myxococcota bacterium]